MTHPFLILQQIEQQLANQVKTTYPPYNILEVNDDTFLIEMAVAGIKQDDISIVVEKQLLTVSYSNKTDTENTTKFLYKGISNKSFSKEFKLNEYVVVDKAEMNEGMLVITLKKVIPEELKPKTIQISNKTKPQILTE